MTAHPEWEHFQQLHRGQKLPFSSYCLSNSLHLKNSGYDESRGFLDRREEVTENGSDPDAQWEAWHSGVLWDCFERTQLFSAGQQVLLIGKDVVEDEELGGDGVALPSSSAALPLLTNRKTEKENISARNKEVLHFNKEVLHFKEGYGWKNTLLRYYQSNSGVEKGGSVILQPTL